MSSSNSTFATIPSPVTAPPRYTGATFDSAVLISLLMLSGFLAVTLVVKTYFIFRGQRDRAQARRSGLTGLERGGHMTANCLEQATVDSFLTFVYTSDVGKGSNDCAVCLGEFVCGNVLKRLPCNHTFHIECIVGWLSVNITCPMCRINLRSELELTAVQVAENRTENDALRPDITHFESDIEMGARE